MPCVDDFDYRDLFGVSKEESSFGFILTLHIFKKLYKNKARSSGCCGCGVVEPDAREIYQV